jgi:hypothetical protein
MNVSPSPACPSVSFTPFVTLLVGVQQQQQQLSDWSYRWMRRIVEGDTTAGNARPFSIPSARD